MATSGIDNPGDHQDLNADLINVRARYGRTITRCAWMSAQNVRLL